MPVYIVTRKADGAEVCRYESAEPVEWDGMAFAEHEHTEAPPAPDSAEPAVPAVTRLTKLQFIDRMGDAAYVAVLQMAKANVAVEAFVKRFEMATPEADGTSVDLTDPRTVAGVTAIGAALQAMGVVDASWVSEVLHG